ncbi:hypothetical protein BH09PLA1_BH09PLA1_20120 [soil metagenome]
MRRLPRVTSPAVLIFIGICALGIAIILPSINRLRMTTRSVPPCASNMRIVGQALLLYSMEHSGKYPQRLDELLGYDWSPSADRFSCATSGKPAVFMSPGATASDLTAEDIVAHEPLSAHNAEGSNVLYGDGHVNWVTPVELARELELTTTRASTRRSR